MNPDKLAKIRKAFDTLKSNELLTSADLSTIGKQGERGERSRADRQNLTEIGLLGVQHKNGDKCNHETLD